MMRWPRHCGFVLHRSVATHEAEDGIRIRFRLQKRRGVPRAHKRVSLGTREARSKRHLSRGT